MWICSLITMINVYSVQCTFKVEKKMASIGLLVLLCWNVWLQWPCFDTYICPCSCLHKTIHLFQHNFEDIFYWSLKGPKWDEEKFQNSYPHLMSDIKLFWRIQQFNCCQWWRLEGCVLYAEGRIAVLLCASLPFEFVLVCRCLANYFYVDLFPACCFPKIRSAWQR